MLKEIVKNSSGVPTGEYRNIAGGTMYADSPIGSILPYGGTTAPSGWMICNGASLLRADYAELFAVIGTAFGSADATHFNIPDLRGEFLRGAGTNSHTGQGSGGNVGQHQNATEVGRTSTSGSDLIIYKQDDWQGSKNYDVISYGTSYNKATGTNDAMSNQQIGGTVRPTNTSVNYIIKAKMVALPADLDAGVDAKLAADGVYSTTEVKTSKTWIDGKPIYRKVITGDVDTYTDHQSGIRRAFSLDHGISNIKHIVQIGGYWSIKSGDYYVDQEYNFGVAQTPPEMTVVYTSTVDNAKASVNTVKSWGITAIKVAAVVEYTKTTD